MSHTQIFEITNEIEVHRDAELKGWEQLSLHDACIQLRYTERTEIVWSPLFNTKTSISLHMSFPCSDH